MNRENPILSRNPPSDPENAGNGRSRRSEFEAQGAVMRQALKEAVASSLRELGSPARLTLELGCGHGHFLSRFASDHREEACLGIDFSRDRITRATRKQERAGLGNLRFLHGEIGDFLEVAPPEVVFTRVFVLYPDPWPKRRHQKFRLMREEFLDEMADKCASGCQLFFRTDSEGYFQQTHQAVGKSGRWDIDLDQPWLHEYPTVFQERTGLSRSLIAVRRSLPRR